MDTFMCSNWYMYRYVDPHNHYAPIDAELARRWLPIDTYTGGAEHAVMHLFYARFFAKAARDMGVLSIDEPFTKLFNQGTITKDGHKMSKSRGKVVNPDEWVARFGADTVRLYLMFLGPWEAGGDWDDSGISGQWRWLNRVWNLALDRRVRRAATTAADTPPRDARDDWQSHRRHPALPLQHDDRRDDGVHQRTPADPRAGARSTPTRGARRSRRCCSVWPRRRRTLRKSYGSVWATTARSTSSVGRSSTSRWRRPRP